MVQTLGPKSYYHTQADDIAHVSSKDMEAAARMMWAALRPLAMGQEKQLMNQAVVETESTGPDLETMQAMTRRRDRLNTVR